MKSPTLSFWLPICVVALFCCSCKDKTKGKQKSEVAQQSAKPISTADSTLFHFWDKFAMQDTAQVKNPEKGEQHLADFIQLLAQTPDSATRDKAVDLMLDKAKINHTSFDYLIQQYEHYLYDGNSPLLRWNKELFSNMNTIFEKIIAQVPVGYLKCLPDAAAAALCHAALFPNG